MDKGDMERSIAKFLSYCEQSESGHGFAQYFVNNYTSKLYIIILQLVTHMF